MGPTLPCTFGMRRICWPLAAAPTAFHTKKQLNWPILGEKAWNLSCLLFKCSQMRLLEFAGLLLRLWRLVPRPLHLRIRRYDFVDIALAQYILLIMFTGRTRLTGRWRTLTPPNKGLKAIARWHPQKSESSWRLWAIRVLHQFILPLERSTVAMNEWRVFYLVFQMSCER